MSGPRDPWGYRPTPPVLDTRGAVRQAMHDLLCLPAEANWDGCGGVCGRITTAVMAVLIRDHRLAGDPAAVVDPTAWVIEETDEELFGRPLDTGRWEITGLCEEVALAASGVATGNPFGGTTAAGARRVLELAALLFATADGARRG